MSLVVPMRIDVVPPCAVRTDDGVDFRMWPVGNRVGEGPAWHPRQRCLYWLDVRGRELLRLRPRRHEVTRWSLPEVVGALALCEGARACLAFPHRLATLDLVRGTLTDLAEVEADRPANRLNDGKVSPSGRWFVFGSMDDGADKSASGGLHRLGGDGSVRRLHDGLVVANGIAWSPDATRLWFSDSAAGRILVADWNETTGMMGRPVELARAGEADGRPDGAAVDDEGRYWTAGVSAGVLSVLDPDGRRVRRVALPCRAPTMPAFGGANGSTVFVTSLVRPTWDAPGPHDGALFAFDAGTTGTVPPLFRLAA